MARRCAGPQDVERALAGVEGVVQALGCNRGICSARIDLFSQGHGSVAADDAAAGRAPSGGGNGLWRGRQPGRHRAPATPAFRLLFGRANADKTRQEELICASGLDLDHLRPGVLVNGRPAGGQCWWRLAVAQRRGIARGCGRRPCCGWKHGALVHQMRLSSALKRRSRAPKAYDDR
jgi:hypothetical protein